MIPFFSVVLPVYNAELFAAKAIDSILQQTFEDFELIIINDGSIDKTKEIIESVKDKKIRLINQENIGLIKTLNYGLGLAAGEYIARMDADDYSYPNRLNIQYNFIKGNPSLVLFSNFFRLIDENDNYIATRRLPTEDIQIRKAIKRWNPFCHPSSVFKRDVALKVGGYPNKKYQEDWELWKKIINYGTVANIPEILLDYRVVSSSESTKKIGGIRKQDNDLHQLRIGVYSLEFDMNKKIARTSIKNFLKKNISFSGVYNFLLTFLPLNLIKLLKNSLKGKYYVN